MDFKISNEFGFDIVTASGIAGGGNWTGRSHDFQIMEIPFPGDYCGGNRTISSRVVALQRIDGRRSISTEQRNFLPALAILARAILIGVAVAIGASFGNIVGRPIRRQFINLFRRNTQIS